MSVKSNLDDIAARLPVIEFRKKKKRNLYYNQVMQSLRGGRQFILQTSPEDNRGKIALTLFEIDNQSRGEQFVIASRSATFGDTDSIHKALKSLEKKAKCKLYYRLLISTDGEYL